MFNFAGQTRKRNINLGTKSKTSKRDILAKAEQERLKRAEERKKNESIILIQSYVRKYIACKQFFGKSIWFFDEEQRIHLFPTFGVKLLHYLDEASIYDILTRDSESLKHYGGVLVNIQVTKTLAEQRDCRLVSDLLHCMNHSYPIPQFFTQKGLIPFLNSAKSLSMDVSEKLCGILSIWNCAGTEILDEVYSVSSKRCRSPNDIANFFICMGEKRLFPLVSHPSLALLENLCLIYSTTSQNDQLLVKKIAECITGLPEQENESDDPLGSQIANIFEQEFIDSLIELIFDVSETSIDISSLASLLNLSEKFEKKNNILVFLLTNRAISLEIFEKVIGLSEEEILTKSLFTEKIITIAIEMINLYLTLTTDSELLSGKSLLSIGLLIEFSKTLKTFIFNQIWNKTQISSPIGPLLSKCIPVLNRIYLRDSRLGFCSKEKPKFWIIEDEKFQRLNLYKIIDNYDNQYRNFKTNVPDDSLSDEEDVEMDAEYTNGKPGSLREDIDNDTKLRYRVLHRMVNESNSSKNWKSINKLEILLKVPFFIPFEQRVDLFYTLIELDKQRLGTRDPTSGLMDMFMPWGSSAPNRQSAVISREHILEDAMKSFNGIGDKFKSKLSVTFVNEFGPEEGIDGGGVTKEFLTSVSEEGFTDPKYDLFQTNTDYDIYPKPTRDLAKLNKLEFLGKIVGKCIYERVLIDVTFADFFLKKLLNYGDHFRSSFDDLSSLDFDLYANLTKLLLMSSEEIDSLDLYFELTDMTNASRTIELIPNGSHVKVTKRTLLQYILKIAEYKLDRTLFEPVYFFHRGVSSLIGPMWLELFNSIELQMLISGGHKNVDLKDLRENTEYGGYIENDDTIKYFWEILEEFSMDERSKFLKFVTSVPQAPLQGFGALEPKFGIRNAGFDLDRLPTASTCVNLLKLPDYGNKELLKEKLLYSINSGARFDLS
ncbi:hypothetical protein KAFR_0B04800 [Kazachstania africana CBS 2517]|uniref:HECT-type E3 ubiquitin transferase n=1 Tax=Kazachstania africana (strain ATCC 22294 / BCRC 22015 / CBS 2517 / CECT 1963 / NBRC 1671 / NRRL Y-8276) TaxID=1071382 RepID=H2AQX6_KAZAF|nr:hypothetical protein KAFR_0B04800 [Kazachstania africana CBS 2517]CCF56776.1 hypothetical protein KAFR_0B04800 [Kazachstania africana CBS 2517]